MIPNVEAAEELISSQGLIAVSGAELDVVLGGRVVDFVVVVCPPSPEAIGLPPSVFVQAVAVNDKTTTGPSQNDRLTSLPCFLDTMAQANPTAFDWSVAW